MCQNATPCADWQSLVDRWLALVRAECADPLGSVGDPADLSDIEAEERRLGRRLPDDYRAFLRVADGTPGHAARPGFLPVREIGPIAAVQGEWLVDVLREHFPEYDGGLVDRAIQISDPATSTASTCLLVPGESGNSGWECWDHQEYSVVRHPSFRDLVERRLSDS